MWILHGISHSKKSWDVVVRELMRNYIICALACVEHMSRPARFGLILRIVRIARMAGMGGVVWMGSERLYFVGGYCVSFRCLVSIDRCVDVCNYVVCLAFVCRGGSE